jgi:hypothetical protein
MLFQNTRTAGAELIRLTLREKAKTDNPVRPKIREIRRALDTQASNRHGAERRSSRRSQTSGREEAGRQLA